MATPLYTTASGRLFHAGQILICCVGLPARGKTHVARSLHRYLLWLGVKVEVFSLGDRRRAMLGSGTALPADYFFTGEKSPETVKLRKKVRESLEEEVVRYFFEKKGQIAIYDANNGAKKARQALRNKFEAMGIHVMFIENVCDDDNIIEENIRAVKLSSPDYKNVDPEEAVKDYWKRIHDHELTYETIEQPSFPYVKIINIGERIVVNNIKGYLQSRIVFFLMNISNTRRKLWFARSGNSLVEHSYKADSGLSDVGVEYANCLTEFIMRRKREVDEERAQSKNDDGVVSKRLNVWTSCRRRCIETAQPFATLGCKIKQMSQMNEINPGVIDGMTVEEIKEAYPEMYKMSLYEPYSHRYPRAESYHDLSVRLEPITLELERDRRDTLIIGHSSVLKCLLAYLTGLAPHKLPSQEIRRGDVLEISPGSYGVEQETLTFWSHPEKSKFEATADSVQSDVFTYRYVKYQFMWTYESTLTRYIYGYPDSSPKSTENLVVGEGGDNHVVSPLARFKALSMDEGESVDDT